MGERWRRYTAALGLFVLAPVSAEYMAGYDDSTGDPVALLAGLAFFGPLYGGAALLIRECARRFDLGWPGVVLLATAFGLVQAGLVDQSLFSTGYRDIGYWSEITGPTLVPALGISGYTATNFVAGHAVWSVCVPVALVEAAAPGQRTRPWLGRAATGLLAAVYVAASALILLGHLETEGVVASRGQLIGASAVAVALVVAAGARARRRRPARITATIAPPAPIVIGAGAFVLALVHLWDVDWLAVLVSLAVLAGVVVAVTAWSRSDRWSDRHVLALAVGASLALAVQGFLATPLGDVSAGAKYGHNVVMALLAMAVATVAAVRTVRADRHETGVPEARGATGPSP